jgi:TolB-like protein
VAVLPLTIPSENPVQRELVTQLFSQELRNTGTVEVVDVPLNSPVGSGLVDIKQLAKEYKVDAVLTGSIDDTRGTVIHLNVQDVATEEVLWSGTYLLGGRAEFFSFSTQQQQFQRGFRRLCERFVSESGVKAPAAK